MNSERKVEITFKDATDSESEPVKLVTPETSERPDSSPEELCSEHSEPIFQAYTSRECSESSVPPALTYSLSSHYASEPSRASLFLDLKQVFNCAYFTAAALASTYLVSTLNNHLLIVFPILFGMFAVGAFVYSISRRVHISDFNITFSQHTRFVIRAIALLIPIPIMAGAMCVGMSERELGLANTAYDAEQYSQATDHLNLAINLNPYNEGAYDAFSRVYFMQTAWGLAIESAQKAISLDPNDSYAWSDKARPLHMMQRDSEAIVAAEKAVHLDPTNGQAFSTLAECYLDSGKYEVALDAAQKHSKIHNTEPYAFELTANILRKLGRDAEAAAADAEKSRL